MIFIAFSPSVSLRSTAIALLRCPDFVYAAWSAAQNRPLRQQMLPLSATGGGRIRCPSEGACVLSNLKTFVTVGTTLAVVRKPQKLVATARRREGVYNRTFSLPCVKGAGLLWRPLHLMQKHRPNRQVRRWVADRQLGGIVRSILYVFINSLSHFLLCKK